MNDIVQHSEQSLDILSPAGFDLAQRAGKLFAASTLVPKDYQGSIPNCVIAMNMAVRLHADPLMVMQNLHIVHGRPAWGSPFMVACANTCGRYDAIRYEFSGEEGTDEWGCTAYARERGSGDVLRGTTVTIAIAKAEGWVNRSGSKWKTMPEQMLRYRAAAWWVRAYAPELSMGLQTREEVEDFGGKVSTASTIESRLKQSVDITPIEVETRKVYDGVLVDIAVAETTEELEKLSDTVDGMGNPDITKAFADRWRVLEEKSHE